MHQGKNILTVEEITSKLPQLRADFEAAFGEGSLKKYYYEQLHSLSLMKDDEINPWNRQAHAPLMAYFMTLALGKFEEFEELESLKQAFKYHATKPVNKDDPEHNANTDEMLTAIHTVVGTYLNKTIPDYDPRDHYDAA